jgi:hypothetical protein
MVDFDGFFGPGRKEVARDGRKLHNEELYNLYFSPDMIRVIKKDEMGEACIVDGRGENCMKFDWKT